MSGLTVSAARLAPGSCLETVSGERRILTKRHLSGAGLSSGNAYNQGTYTVVLEAESPVVDIAVGGVFTHVKSPGMAKTTALVEAVQNGFAKDSIGFFAGLIEQQHKRGHRAKHGSGGGHAALRGNN
jgi:hypothetical protein